MGNVPLLGGDSAASLRLVRLWRKGGRGAGLDFTPKGKSKWPDPKERSGAKFYFPGLTLTAVDSAKHSGVIALFNQHFVKTGMVSNEFGKLLAKAKNIREESDYGDFVIVSWEEE